MMRVRRRGGGRPRGAPCVHTLGRNQAVPRTELRVPRAAPPARGQEGGPLSPPAGRGRGSWGRGGLCLPDSPVETAGRAERRGRAWSAEGRLLPQPGGVPPSAYSVPTPLLPAGPSERGGGDWRQGRWGASRSQPSQSPTEIPAAPVILSWRGSPPQYPWVHLRAEWACAGGVPCGLGPPPLPWGPKLTKLSPFLHSLWDFLPQSP